MRKTKINYFGLTRELPKVKLPSGDTVAFFDSVGDIELINTACIELARFVQDYCVIDRRPTYIVTTEFKGISIAHALAAHFSIPYIALRKSKKDYMTNLVEFCGNSITSGKSSYWIDGATAHKLRGAVVWFIDDVFSTGGTLTLVKDICNYFGATLTFGGFIMQEVKTRSKPSPELNSDIRPPYFEFDDITCFATAILPMEGSEDGEVDTSKQ